MMETKPRYLPLCDVHPARDRKVIYEDARAGRVPAFQFRPRGRWYVDAEWQAFIEEKTHRAEVAR